MRLQQQEISVLVTQYLHGGDFEEHTPSFNKRLSC